MNFFRSLYESFVLYVFFWSSSKMWKIVWAYDDGGETVRAMICADDPQLLDLLLRDGFHEESQR